MKTIKYFIFILLSVLVLTSCNKKDYIAVVPSNASFVATVNVASLAEKSNFAKSDSEKSAAGYLSAILSTEGQKKVKEYMEAPQEMGIDFRAPLYVFVTPNECVGIAMKMLDKDDFESFLKTMQKENLVSKTVKREGVMTGTLVDEIEFGYDDNTILMIASLGKGGSTAVSKQMLSQLFKLEEEDEFVNTERYAKLVDIADRDFAIYSNLSAIPSDYLKNLTALLPSDVKSEDLELLGSVDFQNGKAVMTSQFLGANDKAQKLLDEGNEKFHKLEGKYIDIAATGYPIWASFGANGEWLLENLKKSNDVKMALFAIERGIDIEAMIRSIDGDVAFALPFNALLGSLKHGDFIAMGQLRNSDFMADVNDWKASMKDYGINMVEQGQNIYLLSAEGFKVNWGVNDNTIHFLSVNAALQYLFKLQTHQLTENKLDEYKDEIKGSVGFMYVDLASLHSELVQVMAVSDYNMMRALAQFKSLIFKYKAGNEMEIRVEMKEDRDNFLQTLLKIVNE